MTRECEDNDVTIDDPLDRGDLCMNQVSDSSFPWFDQMLSTGNKECCAILNLKVSLLNNS